MQLTQRVLSRGVVRSDILSQRGIQFQRFKSMKLKSILPCLAVVLADFAVSHVLAETVQMASDVFEGRPYLWVEAESANAITGTPGATWKIVTKGGPDVSVVPAGEQGLPILPTDSNVSGSAIWAPTNDFSSHVPTAQYQLKFITPGTYEFFLRQSLYDSNANGSFLHEESIYLPPAFNTNSGTDWIGFQGLQFDENDPNVEVPTPGFALDPAGWKPSVGDHDRDGLLELANWGIKSEGNVVLHTPSGTLSANGNFNWYNRQAYQGTTQPGNTFDGFYGMKTEFTVTEEMVGQTVNFELGMREVNVVIDGFMFIKTSDIFPDMDILDLHTQEEVDAAILPQPVTADYNGNGVVDAADYVVWRNGDSPDDTQAGYDLWRANFGNGNNGLGASLAAAPEPASVGLLLIGLVAMTAARRRTIL